MGILEDLLSPADSVKRTELQSAAQMSDKADMPATARVSEDKAFWDGMDQARTAPSKAVDMVQDEPPSSIQQPQSSTTDAVLQAVQDPSHAASASEGRAVGDSQHPSAPAEATPSYKDTIPAFIPVVAIKREAQSEAATPFRDSSMPLPTTETTPSEARGVKRPAPKSVAKKGTAKKGPPAKKQKTDSGTTANARPKPKPKPRTKNAGNSLESSPAPHSFRAGSSIARSSQSPGADGYSEADDAEEDEASGSPDPDAELYCICRKPDTGTFMIGCDGGCDDWFHGKCVGIAEKDKGLIDRYMCPRCVAKGKKNGTEVVTTWKRMCRRPGCRLPARLAKKDEEPSKYCSDACGVDFFREVMGRTRGSSRDDGKKSSRRKASLGSEDLDDYDPGPRGSVLNKSELKALVQSVSTFEEFKQLGNGVLSPPATPPPSGIKAADREKKASTAHLTDSEVRIMSDIEKKKDELRTRHSLLRDQSRFINILRQTGGRAAEAKGMKSKDVCGYDERSQWEEEMFAMWRASAEGQAVLKSGVLELKVEQNGDATGGAATESNSGPCMKRKCAKHFDWSKLALETNRFETSENSERMRGLEREEREIQERAGLRARQLKAGEIGGVVERHDVLLRDGTPLDGRQNASVTAEGEVGGHDGVDVEVAAGSGLKGELRPQAEVAAG